MRKREGIKAILNRENDEKNDELMRINQRKLIFSFVLASRTVPSFGEGMEADTASERCETLCVTFYCGLLGCNERTLYGLSFTHFGLTLGCKRSSGCDKSQSLTISEFAIGLESSSASGFIFVRGTTARLRAPCINRVSASETHATKFCL